MPSNDIRISGWDLPASAGMTYSMEFTSSQALTSLALYVGGTLDDVDDLTGATAYDAVLSGGNLIATVSLDVPAGEATPLRLVVDGAVVTVGYLRPSTAGAKALASSAITLNTGSISIDLSVPSIAGGSHDHDADYAASVHTHDDRYYTEAEVDTALSGKSDTSHNHAGVYDPAGTTAAAVAAHEGAADPHPGYLTAAEGNAAYEAAGAVAAHVTDADDAHDASAISIADAGGLFVSTDVEGALQEVASGTSRLWLAAADLEIASGSPALSAATGNWLSWLMDPASIEGVGSSRHLPSDWNTYDVQLWWVNGGAGAGDVSWRFDVSFVGAGDTLAAPATGSVVTATAGAQNVVVTTTLASGLSATTSELLGFRMFRIANGGGDTLANDAGILGLLLTKAS